MYKITEVENGKVIGNYNSATKDAAIAVANKLMWDYVNYYGHLNGDLDNVVDSYAAATEVSMTARADVDGRHWNTTITEQNLT